MCVVSMVQQHYIDKWKPNNQEWNWPQNPLPQPPSQAEIEEFRRLLDRAREYDKTHDQPDCELDIKRKILQDLAQAWGIELYKEKTDAT
jgi:hypothetical protein